MFVTRVLVTGATGFLAGHAIQELLTHGYAVRGTVRNLATADVAHLRAMVARTGGELEFVEASLDSDTGWGAAVEGCTSVWHLASPVPLRSPKHDEDVIRPAVDGTLRVLRAAAESGARRVIMTSSIDAVRFGGNPTARVRDENDWSSPQHADAYGRSKLFAERTAWEFVRDRPLELVTLQPGLILGPLLHAERTGSIEAVRLLMAGSLPAVPRLGFAVVDARDVAVAHRLAMELPGASGNRYILAGESMWMADIAAILAREFAPRGYRIPRRTLPSWLVRTIARFDGSMRRVLGILDVPVEVSAAKARRQLDWSTRAAADTIIDTAQSLLEHGVVRRRGPLAQVSPARRTPQAPRPQSSQAPRPDASSSPVAARESASIRGVSR